MSNTKLIIKKVTTNGRETRVTLHNGTVCNLRPFVYLKAGDELEFAPKVENWISIKKVFKDKATGEQKRVIVEPPYSETETLAVPPHKFEVTFRERKNEADWQPVKSLEQFHYRGMGLNKIVGRRTVLIAEMKNVGVVGYGVLSASVAAAAPRFKLLETNFKEQMRSGTINQIARIPRIVVHPEYRGLNLGVLIAKHLVAYAKTYWDINGYSPKLIEVIAAMTEYHRFFQKAGFFNAGYTAGYNGTGILPKYGNGSFESRDSSTYRFMQNQGKKPYLVFPISRDIRRKLCDKSMNTRRTQIVEKSPTLKSPLVFDRLSVKYQFRNGSTDRTRIVKDVFGIDAEQAFSPIFSRFSIRIDPGDVVLVTGASGSGKSTLLKLLTMPRSILKNTLEWEGAFPLRAKGVTAKLECSFDDHTQLIDQVCAGRQLGDAIRLLNSVGLTEAHLYVKRPNQISDGQKYRFAVAKLCDSGKPVWVADEFLTSLNPEIAAVVASGLRKIAYKMGATLLLAAPHSEAFLESLLPNKIVRLSWAVKPKVCSLNLFKAVVSRDGRVVLRVKNTGSSVLTNLRFGLVSTNGVFRKQFTIPELRPSQETGDIEVTSRAETAAAKIVTSEGVGEILYLKPV